MVNFENIKFDKNIMYQYANTLSSGTEDKSGYLKTDGTIMVDGIPFHCNTVLIWFVFYHLLNCSTLEQAMRVYTEQQKEIDDFFKIRELLKRNTLIFPRNMRMERKIRYVLQFFYDKEQGVKDYQDMVVSSGAYNYPEETENTNSDYGDEDNFEELMKHDL